MKVATIVFLAVFVAVPVLAQEAKEPNLTVMKKDLRILNLQKENIELKYNSILRAKKNLEANIKKVEAAAAEKDKKKKE